MSGWSAFLPKLRKHNLIFFHPCKTLLLETSCQKDKLFVINCYEYCNSFFLKKGFYSREIGIFLFQKKCKSPHCGAPLAFSKFNSFPNDKF